MSTAPKIARGYYACGLLIQAFLGACIPPCFAHPDLVEQLILVTEQLNSTGPSAELLRTRADLFRRHGQLDAALDDLNLAASHGSDAELGLDRARVLFDAGRLPEALHEIHGFVDRQPDHGDAKILRARIRARLGQTEGAIQDFTGGIRSAGTAGPDAFLERARLQASLGRLEEAVRGLEEALAGATGASPLVLAAIDYDRQRGAFDSALVRVDALVSQYPVKEPWLTLRAEILSEARRTAEAEETFRNVIAGIGRYPEHRRRLPLTEQLLTRARAGLDKLQNADQVTTTKIPVP